LVRHSPISIMLVATNSVFLLEEQQRSATLKH
jgi:hypothetical protein